MDGLFRYVFEDPEITVKGLLLAKDMEDAVAKAYKICHITHPEDEETLPEVTHIMSKDKFETLVVTGSVETFYDDWD
ncbi:hypothetical protein [Bacillus phage CP-51]|uniref:Uncharacterized protein n=1 Tax=Bacillus phage CP-51 TaxID=1391188 RepID=A0A068EMG8_9CAUD|nr:hypothetical protein OZ73_gp138 [Bacillus phage CP-51]AID50573.1 hypothetical protein [Bacillus phage CP-51]